jgi:uncharacterized membrane protein
MWIIGLLLGLVIGGAINGFEGAILGALIGWAIGYGFSQLVRSHDAKVKGAGVESRLASVEAALRALDDRLSALEGKSRVGAPTAPLEHERGLVSTQLAISPASPVTAEPKPIEPTPASAELGATQPAALAASPEQPAEPVSPSAPQPPALPPRSPKAPREPSFIWRWFMGGNTLVRAGVVVLFFGIAFLLKYAYEHTRIPIELRLTGVAIAAVVLLAIGWHLRLKRPGYALALQGGGVGMLYLTVFAAFRLYQLLPPEAALVLLFLIASLSAALAVMQDAQSLAVLGASGGFLAPILASTGGGSHVMLFSYYVMLNVGIVGIAWYKAWRPLNLLGFLFTFGIGTLWGSRFYRPALLESTEPFLVIFFLMYLAIPVLFARRRARPAAALGAQEVQNYVDGTLVFGTPLVAFGLQTQLVRELEYGSAWSALALSFVYLVVARWLWSRHRDELRLLVESFLALGVVFGTLAIPLALDGRWTSAAWALEGAAILWAGVRQHRWLARSFGLFLQIAAGFAFLTTVGRTHGDIPVLNSVYLGCAFISIAGFFSSWYLERNRERLRSWEPGLAVAIFVWALLWWIGGGAHEINAHVSGAYQTRAGLLFTAGSCLAFSLLWKALSWRLARYPALALLPAMMLLALDDAADRRHPLAHLGAMAWPAAFAAHLWLLRRHDDAQNRYISFMHAGQLWLFTALASWELAWAIDDTLHASWVWGMIAWGIVPGLLLGLLATRAQQLPWPVRGRLVTYALLGAAPLAVFLWAWILVANATSDGNASPLPYVPLLNPLDLAQFAAWLAIIAWIRGLKRMDLADYIGDEPALIYSALGAIGFIGLNGSLLRALHHWAAIPYDLDAMLHSVLVQTALSIFWSVLALCTMAAATRLRVRVLWIVGASLMAVVVAKLVLVDLSNIGTVERIVSFIGVGLLMLLIGYLSPVPPKASESST